ncbi:MAG: septum formation initiator family protein [Clostridia bacterium]|nr:septum formation initiator family protein [Clostridia bacterium]
MKQKPKRKKSVIVRLIVLGVSVYMVATLVGLGNELASAKAELEAYERQRDSLQLTVSEYKALLESDSHAAIIEKAARERLGYVYSDEEIYIDISGN